jgi:hypothetical protein
MTPDRIALPIPCLETDTQKEANQISVRFAQRAAGVAESRSADPE